MAPAILDTKDTTSSQGGSTPGADDQTSPRGRVSRACDRCRCKKRKCDGHQPCHACAENDSICTFTTRRRFDDKRVYSYAHVHFLEQQIQHQATGLQKMYRMLCESNRWPRSSHAVPSVHEILATLDTLNEATPWESKDDSGPMNDTPSSSSSETYFLQDVSSAVDETEALYFDDTDLLRIDCELDPSQDVDFWLKRNPAPSMLDTFTSTQGAVDTPSWTARRTNPLLTYPDVS